MTQSVLLVNGITAGGSATAMGGGGFATLSDTSDTTYYQLDSVTADTLLLSFDNLPALPSGAYVKYALLVFHDAKITYDNVAVITKLNIAGMGISATFVCSWGIFGTGFADHWISGAGIDSNQTNRALLTETQVNAATVNISTFGNDYAISKATLYVGWVTKPTVAIVSPTTSVTNDNSPVYVWSTTFDSDGYGSQFWEVKVFTNAVKVAGGFSPDTATTTDWSGIQQGSPTPYGSAWLWEGQTALENGTYWVYVRHADLNYAGDWSTSPLWSNWVGEDFVVAVDAPNAPTMTLTTQPTNGRVRIVVTDQGGVVASNRYQVQCRLYGTSDEWEAVRTELPNGMTTQTSPATVYDYEHGTGILMEYRARAIHDYPTSNTFGYSPWSSVAAMAWTTVTDWWLKHPYNPALNYKPRLRSQPSRVREARQAVFQPLGRRNPVVVSDTPTGWKGQIVFRSDSNADRDLLYQITADNVPLLLQGPGGSYWSDTWLMLSDLTQERVIDAQWSKHTFDSADWVEVDRPTP